MGQSGREGARQDETWTELLLQEQSRHFACPGGADCPWAGTGARSEKDKTDNYKMVSSGVPGRLGSPRGIQQCLKTFLIITAGEECSRGGQGCC